MNKHFNINYAEQESNWKDLTIVNLLSEISDLEDKIDKAIEFIEDGDLLYLTSKCSVIYRDNIEVVAIRDRLIELLDILKGSDSND